MSLQNTVSFNVKLVGDVTKNTFEGVFEAKTKLSIKENLKEEELVRRFLGVNSQEASSESRMIAGAVAYLAMRIVKAPQWWKDSNGGQDLEDMNVLAGVNNAAQAKIAEEYEKLATEADKARPILKEQIQS
jgi:hypothetical protein